MKLTIQCRLGQLCHVTTLELGNSYNNPITLIFAATFLFNFSTNSTQELEIHSTGSGGELRSTTLEVYCEMGGKFTLCINQRRE